MKSLNFNFDTKTVDLLPANLITATSLNFFKTKLRIMLVESTPYTFERIYGFVAILEVWFICDEFTISSLLLCIDFIVDLYWFVLKLGIVCTKNLKVQNLQVKFEYLRGEEVNALTLWIVLREQPNIIN